MVSCGRSWSGLCVRALEVAVSRQNRAQRLLSLHTSEAEAATEVDFEEKEVCP